MLERLLALIEALREEVRQCGEMLALLEPASFESGPAASSPFPAAIDRQVSTITEARRHRDQCQRRLAVWLEQPAEAGLARLIPLVPPDYRPLLGALRHETAELQDRVSQALRLARPALGTIPSAALTA